MMQVRMKVCKRLYEQSVRRMATRIGYDGLVRTAGCPQSNLQAFTVLRPSLLWMMACVQWLDDSDEVMKERGSGCARLVGETGEGKHQSVRKQRTGGAEQAEQDDGGKCFNFSLSLLHSGRFVAKFEQFTHSLTLQWSSIEAVFRQYLNPDSFGHQRFCCPSILLFDDFGVQRMAEFLVSDTGTVYPL